MGNEASNGGPRGSSGGGWSVSTNMNSNNHSATIAGNSVAKQPSQQSTEPPASKKWTYQQSTGILCTPENVCSKIGYSGAGVGKNNPKQQSVPFVGPIPQGDYVIGKSVDSPNTGKLSIILTPTGDQDMHNRNNFRIHGDSAQKPGEASEGCIVLPKAVREKIDKSKIKDLTVIE